jgi:hypothetical protein
MSYRGKLTATSYPGPTRRPRSPGPPRHHRGPVPEAGAPLRWPITHGPAQARVAQAGLACRLAAAGCRPALEGNPGQHQHATHQRWQPIHQYSWQLASTRGNWACFVRFGPGSFIFHFCLRASRFGAYHSRVAANRGVPEIALSHYQHWVVNPAADRAGLKTQESGRGGCHRAGAKAMARAVICRKPGCTMRSRRVGRPAAATILGQSQQHAASHARATDGTRVPVNLAVTNVAV